MRAWFSVPIIKGVRTGISVNANPTARIYPVSATDEKICHISSTLMLAGLAIWLVASRDAEGRLSEIWWLVMSLVLCCRYLFKLAIVALFPPIAP